MNGDEGEGKGAATQSPTWVVTINYVKSKVPVHTSALNLGLLLRETEQFGFNY